MKSSVLVTGGAGFIGSHVTEELLRRGHEVLVLDDLSGGFRENIPRGASFVRGSVTNGSLIERLFARHRFEFVFHLASYAAEGLSHFIRSFNYRNNLLGSIHLINAAVNCGTVKCFVFSSSIAVYGQNLTAAGEDRAPQPADPYGIAKYAVELDLLSAHQVFGLNYIIFRPHNVYGERQNLADPFRNVIGIFMNQIMRGRPMTIFGEGRQRRAFTHIGDVAPIIAESISRPAAYNQIFNVGSDRVYTVLEAAQSVSAAFGVAAQITHLPERIELDSISANHEKAGRFFGDLVRNTPLEEGLVSMAKWARHNGALRKLALRKIEVPKNLPASWATLFEVRPGRNKR